MGLLRPSGCGCIGSRSCAAFPGGWPDRAWHSHVLPGRPFSACGLEAGELVALSLEGCQPQAARAWVHGVQAGSITLALDRPLRPGLVQQGQVCFVGEASLPEGHFANVKPRVTKK